MKKIIMLCVVLLTFKNYSQEVGVTEGQLSVSLKGSAQYSIPIAVPPGINGVLPQISLNYDSQGANGLAGYGWSIGGVSTITRIPSTKYHDGINDPVDFDSLDRFAFDGQRLLLKTGTYGANGATYETENFSNHKITSYGVHPNGANYGPAYFKVQYPDGAIAYFGNSTNSRSLNQYAITYWENVQGVRISYYYNLYNNFLSVRSIKYGSRFTETAINVIDFIYKDRQRPEEFYIGGLKFSMNSILNEISIKGNMKGFKSYILEHDITTLGYERLKSITEKTGDGTKTLRPTIFDYEITGEAVSKYPENTQILQNNIDSRDQTISGNFNSNNNLDFLLFRKYRDKERKDYKLYKDLTLTPGPKTGFTHLVGVFEEIFSMNYLKGNEIEGYKISPTQGWCVVKTDAVSNKTYFSVYSAGEDPINPITTEYQREFTFPKRCNSLGSALTRINRDYLSGDFNGDGLTDMLVIDRGFSYFDLEFVPCDENNNTPIGKTYFVDLAKNQTNNYVKDAGSVTICPKNGDNQIPNSCKTVTGDANGDGKTDLILFKFGHFDVFIEVYNLDSNNNIVLLSSTQLSANLFVYHFGLPRQMEPWRLAVEPILTGDFNGDGKTDFMLNGKKIISTGSSFLVEQGFITNTDINQLFVTDFNNDGKSDLLEVARSNNTGLNGANLYSLNWIINKNGNFSKAAGNFYSLEDVNGIGNDSVPVLLTSPSSSKKNEIAFFTYYNNIAYFPVENDFSKDKLLKSITNGDGVKESISYNSLEAICPENCFSVYVPNAPVENYPNLDILMAPTFQVVSKLEKKSSSVTKRQLFAYHGGVANVNGLGFLGFRSTLRTNWHDDPLKIISNVSKNDINLRGINVENYSVPHLVPLNASTPSNFISKTINTYNTYDNVNIEPVLLPNKVFKLRNTISKQYNGLENTSTEKTIIYDEYNNAKKTTVDIKEGTNIIQTSISDIVYENQPNGSTYFIGRPLNSTQNTTIYPNNNDLKDVTSTEEIYTYSNNLLTKIMKKGHLTDYITEENAYDVFGNIIQKTISATGLAPRIKKFEYNPTTPNFARFLTKTAELENGQEKLIQQYTYDDISGVLLSETNHLGNKTTYLYDGWFKNIKITDYLGKDTDVLYSRSILRTDKSITITKNGSDGSSVMAQYDDLGRKIKEGNKNIDGNWSYINRKYDINDKVIGVSEPYTGLAIIKWNNTSYDNYGRPSQVVAYSGKTTAFSYTGLTKTVTDDVKTVTTTRNAIGNTILLTEAGSTINYKYFANGNLKESNYDGIKTEITQDGWGRKIILKDPSSGQFEYKYNSLGELTEEKNLNGTTTFVIDDFGKTIEKTVAGTGGNTANTKAVYTYHPDTKLITAMRFDDFTAGNFTNYSFGYDNYKRLIFNDESGFLAYYQQAIQYDEFGRPYRQLYHSESTNTGKKSIKWVKNTYKNGYQWQILDDATNTVLWQTNTVNVRGQLSSAKLGNGIEVERKYDQYGFPTEIKYFKTTPATNYLTLNYSFNPVTGNLTGRTNSAFNFSEAFEYDNLDRLKNFTNAQGVAEIQNYDTKGRITVNNLGVYNYTDPNKVYQNTSINLSPEARGYYQNREGVFNDDMESKSGWTTYYHPATSVYYDNTESKTGAYSLKVNNTVANSERVVGSEIWIPINNAVATEYTYSVWVKSDGPQAELFMFMKKQDEVNAFTSLSQVTTNVTGEWFLLQKTVLVPANIKMLNLRVDNNGTGNIWFDDARIKKTSNAANALRELNISYNPFKSPIQIEETGVDKVSFDYNEADNRATMFYGGLQDKMLRPLRKHYSMDGSMEIKYNIETGENEFVTYIGGDGYTAPIALKSNGTTQKYLYLLRDYQGSIVAIYDDQANVLEKRMFDAWGNVIKILDGAGNSLSQLAVLDRGYTGHEHIQSVGLINMNGRLYDPLLHRFIQPDNNIQDPFNPQNYNRYGYVLNNPLKYTDPSGEFWGEFLAGLVYAYFGGVSANNGDFNPTNWDYSSTETWTGMLFAAASAEASIAATNYINGDFSQGKNGISPYVVDAVIFTEGITSNFRQGVYDRVDDMVYFFQEQALSSDYWRNTLTPYLMPIPRLMPGEYDQIIENISNIPNMSANEWAYAAGYSSPDIAIGVVSPYALESMATRLGSLRFTIARTESMADDLIRVRHHTSPEALKQIKKSDVIHSSRGVPYGVDVEVAPFLDPSKVHMGQAGKGAYIEFSVDPNRISSPPGYMGGVGNPGRIVTEGAPFSLKNTNPKFVKNWIFW